jgi:hypothetical protein
MARFLSLDSGMLGRRGKLTGYNGNAGSTGVNCKEDPGRYHAVHLVPELRTILKGVIL